MHTTTRLGLQVPDGPDDVSVYPPVSAQQMGILDESALYLSGTLSARPAASLDGRFYRATDTGVVYLDNGSAWVPLNASGISRQYHSWTMDDQTSPNPATVVLGSFFIAPASGETVTLVEAIVHCVTVGSTPSRFKVRTDHGSHGTLADVAGLAGLQPSTSQAASTVTGGPMSLSALDRIAVVVTTAGNSLGCSIDVVTEHTG